MNQAPADKALLRTQLQQLHDNMAEDKEAVSASKRQTTPGRGFVNLYEDNATADVTFNKSSIQFQEVQKLLTWVLADGTNPTWVFVRNKLLVSQVALVVVPALHRATVDRHASRLPFLSQISPSTVTVYLDCGTSTYNYNFSRLFTVPLSKQQKKELKRARPSGQGGVAGLLSPHSYCMSMEDMHKSGYLLPVIDRRDDSLHPPDGWDWTSAELWKPTAAVPLEERAPPAAADGQEGAGSPAASAGEAALDDAPTAATPASSPARPTRGDTTASAAASGPFPSVPDWTERCGSKDIASHPISVPPSLEPSDRGACPEPSGAPSPGPPSATGAAAAADLSDGEIEVTAEAGEDNGGTGTHPPAATAGVCASHGDTNDRSCGQTDCAVGDGGAPRPVSELQCQRGPAGACGVDGSPRHTCGGGPGAGARCNVSTGPARSYAGTAASLSRTPSPCGHNAGGASASPRSPWAAGAGRDGRPGHRRPSSAPREAFAGPGWGAVAGGEPTPRLQRPASQSAAAGRGQRSNGGTQSHVATGGSGAEDVYFAPYGGADAEGVRVHKRAKMQSDHGGRAAGVLDMPELTGGLPMYALDCEMCLTAEGSELTRASVVDHTGKCVLDEFVVPPNPIVDYVTRWSGITPAHLEGVTTKREDVVHRLKHLLAARGAVLIGHDLRNDFQALRFMHGRVMDTVHLFPHPRGLPHRCALRSLAQKFLHRRIQQGTHDSVQDARTAMELALLKIKHGPTFGTEAAGPEGRKLPLLLTDQGQRMCFIDRWASLQGTGMVVGLASGVGVDTDEQVVRHAVKELGSRKTEPGSSGELRHRLVVARLLYTQTVRDRAINALRQSVGGGSRNGGSSARPQAAADAGGEEAGTEGGGGRAALDPWQEPQPEELPAALAKLDAGIRQIWDAAQPNCLFLVLTLGDTGYSRFLREHKQRVEGRGEWTLARQDKYTQVLDEASQGCLWAAVKQG